MVAGGRDGTGEHDERDERQAKECSRHDISPLTYNPRDRLKKREGWAQLPNGRAMGAVGKVSIDPDGRHIWAIVRCDRLEDPSRFGDECRDSKTDPILKFSPDGKVVKSFGGGMFIWPRGLDVESRC
jgi:hypothetical protein